MGWHTGLQRLRVVGSIALAIGALLCASVLITRSLGYAPDASVASVFAAMWPTGLVLMVLGGLTWVGVWVLQGFVPAASLADKEPVPRRAHLSE